MDVQQQLNTSKHAFQSLQGELRQVELEAKKKLLVDTFYNEISLATGLLPKGRIDYDQFWVGANGKRSTGHLATKLTL